MQQILKTIVLVTLMVCSLFAAEVKFGVYTSDKASVMYKKFKPIVDYLEEDAKANGVDMQITLKIYPTYEGAINGIVKGEYDFARFGPASYIMAKEQNDGISLLAMEQNKGKKTFNGVFITREDSKIRTLRDLKGKSFAFGDDKSTIGRYLAQSQMVQNDIFAKDLKNYKYLGRHDKVALAIANGDFDAGVVKESTLKKYKDRGLKAIGSFQNVSKPWLAKANINPEIFDVLKQSLLKLKDEKVLKVIKKSGFFETSDQDYEIIRKGMEESKNF